MSQASANQKIVSCSILNCIFAKSTFECFESLNRLVMTEIRSSVAHQTDTVCFTCPIIPSLQGFLR